MKRPLRVVLATLAAALLLPATTLAAAPRAKSAPVVNDEPGGAIAVVIGETYTQDTREATASAVDTTLNEQCGAPAVTHSVWYKYTEDRPEGGGFVVEGVEPTFDLGFMIVLGDPEAGGLVVGCGPQLSAAMTTVGNTYYIMAFTASATDGGNLTMTVSPAPEPPTTAVTLDGTGSALADGSALVRGTYSCTNAFYSELTGRLVQTVGRLKITGYFGLGELVCDGTTQTWSAVVTSENGLFAGGKSVAVAVTLACGLLDCAQAGDERAVKLTRARLK